MKQKKKYKKPNLSSRPKNTNKKRTKNLPESTGANTKGSSSFRLKEWKKITSGPSSCKG